MYCDCQDQINFVGKFFICINTIAVASLVLTTKISLMISFYIQTVFLVIAAILIRAIYFVTCAITLSSIVKQTFESFMSRQFLTEKIPHALLKVFTSYLGQS